MCFFAETKLDSTFNINLFNIPNYKTFRNDRNSSGGGLIAYVRSSIPARRRLDLELDLPIETIVLDIQINSQKWAIIGAYRPPSVKDSTFTDILTKGLDKISIHFDNMILIGDLNYDCLDKTKSETLTDICDIFDFKNLIKDPTCFMKNCSPSLVDVVLTNKSQFCFNPINFGCGISDWHNMIGVLVKGAAPKVEKQKIKYRSYKNFDEKCFNDDISQVPFHVAHVFEDVDDIYWAHEWLLNDVINQHAPIKERISKPKKPAL